MISKKRYPLIDRLIATYGKEKALRAVAWYTKEHTQSFRDAIKNAEKFIDNNQLLWNDYQA